MEDDTSTVQDAPVVADVTDAPVQTEDVQATDVQDTAEPSEAQQDVADAPEVDEKLKRYAESQGIELDSPSAIKAARIAQSNQSEATKTYQKAKELETTMGEMSDQSAQQVAEATGQDPGLIQRLQRMEVKESIRDFFEANPDARQYEAQMSKIAVESGLYGSPDAILKASYAIARSQDTSTTDAIKSQARTETLKNLAQKQQAAVPTGNATNSGTTPKEKAFSDLSIKEMEAKLGFVR